MPGLNPAGGVVMPAVPRRDGAGRVARLLGAERREIGAQSGDLLRAEESAQTNDAAPSSRTAAPTALSGVVARYDHPPIFRTRTSHWSR